MPRAMLVDKAALATVAAADVSQGRAKEWCHTIVWGAGCAAGAVVVEAAHDPAYAGTWALLATVPWSAASKVDVVNVTGVYEALRHRISVGVVGGTVSTYLKGA